jgi:hypothetical protein
MYSYMSANHSFINKISPYNDVLYGEMSENHRGSRHMYMCSGALILPLEPSFPPTFFQFAA